MRDWYMGWQMNMKDTKQSVSDALTRYFDKFGLPPQILLVSDKLEKTELPEGLELVVKVHHFPKNILLVGDDTESI